jgi:hypothetical protein
MEPEEPKFKVVPFKKKEEPDEEEEEEVFTPDMMLDKAKGVYKIAIVLGWDNDEELQYFISKGGTSAEALLLLELVKTDIVSNMFDDD